MDAAKLILYSTSISPPARFVLMTMKSLNLKAEIKEVDLFKGEQKTPEYAEVNPMKKIPCLVDGDTIVRDSHAICTYLINKYNPMSLLYPEDAAARVRVDEMLCFNMTKLFPANSNAMTTYFQIGIKMLPQTIIDDVLSSYELLNIFLKKDAWLAGKKVTLADLCCLATMTSAELLVPLDEERFPLTAAWLAKCKELPVHLTSNQPGVERLKNLIDSWETHQVS